MPTRPLVTRYEDDLKLFPDIWHKIGLVLGIVAMLAYPWVMDSHWITIGNLALTAVVGSLALMILTGFCGQISLGHAAFLALGAYTVAILGEHAQLPFWLCLPISGLVAGAVGMLIGPFALRLEGLYLAIVTIGLIFLVNHVLLAMPELTGGVSGIAVPMHMGFSEASGSFQDTWTLGPLEFDFGRKLYFLYAILAIGITWMTKNIQRSNTGRAMMAVRDQDIAAAVLGVAPAKTKLLSFGLSSFFAGIAGAMFAFQQQYLTVAPPFDMNMSVQYIAIVVLGGIGTVFGAVAGALFFVVLSPLAELVGEHIPLLKELSSAQQATVLFAIVVCGFLLFEPLGLVGIWFRIKRYFAAWPFRY